MSKKLLSGTLLVVVGVGAAYVWTLTRMPANPQTLPAPLVSEIVPEVPTANESVAGRGPLRAVMALGQNLECQIKVAPTPGQPSESEGSVFLSQGMLRGDFMMTVEGLDTVSSMITKDERLYVWSIIEGIGYGVEMAMSDARATSTLSAREPVGLDEDVRYDCKRWGNVDKSVFTPPDSVLFRNMTSVMQEGMDFGETFVQ